jgi:hypothetical protein
MSCMEAYRQVEVLLGPKLHERCMRYAYERCDRKAMAGCNLVCHTEGLEVWSRLNAVVIGCIIVTALETSLGLRKKL